jgi:hypothetical protein
MTPFKLRNVHAGYVPITARVQIGPVVMGVELTAESVLRCGNGAHLDPDMEGAISIALREAALELLSKRFEGENLRVRQRLEKGGSSGALRAPETRPG